KARICRGRSSSAFLSKFGLQLPPAKSNMNDHFKDKVTVITGGSSGIGRAAGLAFAAEGVRVVIGARRAAECEETVQLIQQQGGDACFVETDVTQSDQVQRLVKMAIDRWHRLDFAFNNAGIEGSSFVLTAEYSEQVWDEVIDI